MELSLAGIPLETAKKRLLSPGPFGRSALLSSLRHGPAAAFPLEDLHHARQILGRRSVRTMQPQLAFFHLRPNTSLHLRNAEEAGFPAPFQLPNGFS
ncbi:MAG TPA: hypothetical protein VMA13_12245 [Candidatus Saccharimonadales bacterium]|nr:hypothetical protein [Candidatus Saccharimonadales bacterium]